MSPPPVAAVQFGDLLEVVWVSALAGIGVVAMFSLVIFAGARATEARRAGGNGVPWTFLAILACVVVFAAIVEAVRVMATK